MSTIAPTYRIRDWQTKFENAGSRKVHSLSWIPIPNKHDGASYRRVAALPNAPEVMCGWILAVQVASKMPVRGVLRDADGPLDAADLALKTGFPAQVFTAAFEALTAPKIQWLEMVPATSNTPSCYQHATSTLPEPDSASRRGIATGQDRTGEVATATSTTTTQPAAGSSPLSGSAYPTLEEAQAYAASQTQRLIRPEWVEKWYLDRDRKNWTYDTRSGNQVPIPDWRKDLQFYAKSWKDNDDRKLVRQASKDEVKAAKAKSKLNGKDHPEAARVATVAEPPPANIENPFPAMFEEQAERRRQHEQWLSTPHDADEQSPFL